MYAQLRTSPIPLGPLEEEKAKSCGLSGLLSLSLVMCPGCPLVALPSSADFLRLGPSLGPLPTFGSLALRHVHRCPSSPLYIPASLPHLLTKKEKAGIGQGNSHTHKELFSLPRTGHLDNFLLCETWSLSCGIRVTPFTQPTNILSTHLVPGGH